MSLMKKTVVALMAVSAFAWADVAFDTVVKKAQSGDAAAQAELAEAYSIGSEIDLNTAEAMKWAKKAADQGSPEGLFLMAFFTETGLGVVADKVRGREWYKLAADKGHLKAQGIVGKAHFEEGDYVNAKVWLHKAAERGDADSLSIIGNMYAEGKGEDKDEEKALNIWKEASAKESQEGLYALALCYQNGKGVEKDEVKAMELFRKAMKAGNDLAIIWVAMEFYNGSAKVPADKERALAYFGYAADEANDPEGHYMQGVCYEQGEGTAQDLDMAKACYKEAADMGHEAAKKALERLK